MSDRMRDFLLNSDYYMDDETMDEMELTKDQKSELEHVIINILTNPSIARLLRELKKTKGNEISLKRSDAEVIINNLGKIRKFILDIQIVK